MKHMSKIASGTPLPQTSPASIERYLIDRIRQDLGSFKDLATITPILKVDANDGDMSGNITNAYGTLALELRGSKVYVPFIIHNKELLPFDEIRLGEQKVSYDPSKLRKIINGIDQEASERGEEGDGSTFSIGDVVDSKKVRSDNGFLGTIMQIRDDEATRNQPGSWPYEGLNFGAVDDARLDHKMASTHVDVLEVFQNAMEKIAQTKSIPQQAIDQYLQEIEKQAAEKSQKAIDQSSAVKVDTLETAGLQRGLAKLTDEKLADVGRAASGNDIKFPTADGGHFEYRYGRVYHNIEPWAKNDKEHTVSPIKGIVVDSKQGYKILRDGDKFMMTTEKPPIFDFKAERARGLTPSHMYAMEINETTISYPFTVENRHMSDMLGHGIHFRDDDRTMNSLFSEAMFCCEAVPAKNTDPDSPWTTERRFTILIARDEAFQGVKHMNNFEIREYIHANAKDPADTKLAIWMVENGGRDVYIVNPTHQFYKMEKAIEGYFSRPDGYFKEGPLYKSAAYGGSNQVKLIVTRDNQPRQYSIKWQFADEIEGGEGGMTNLQRRQQDGLSEQQARQMLLNLGFDNRKVETFFEIAKRNGREARFDLPDVDKAKSISPSDAGAKKKGSALGGIIKNTLNSRNFMPIFEDLISEGVAQGISGVAPQTADWARKADSFFKTSYEVAVGIEKIATKLGGEAWYELAALTNLKHQLDKTAGQALLGNYVSGMNDVFGEITGLRPAIEKHASYLLEMNRDLILGYDVPPVEPKLIKEAMAQLDGLYRYAGAYEEPQADPIPETPPVSGLLSTAGAFQGKK